MLDTIICTKGEKFTQTLAFLASRLKSLGKAHCLEVAFAFNYLVTYWTFQRINITILNHFT